MSEHIPAETPVCPSGSVTQMWNEKATLANEIEKLIRPFAHKWLLGRIDQVNVACTYHGVSVEVRL